MKADQYKEHRSKSLRLQNWDYSRTGFYFITICTKNKKRYFGEIIGEKMKLSPIGVMADILWHEIKYHAKDIDLDEFVVMPNHIHGILILNNPSNPVETGHALSLQKRPAIGQTRFQHIGTNTLPSIIGGYKSAVTRHARRLGFTFAWQRNYWERIIRDENECRQIRQYIVDNPLKWEIDKLNGQIENLILESE